jgi:catechol 2,3-dioxygenase-like lactoylglutathione lyase family enzyme
MRGLSHIGLKTTDLARAERFYAVVLDGRVLNRRDVPDRRIWLDVRGVRLEIAERPVWDPLNDDQRRALPMVAFLVGPDEVDPLVAALTSWGVPHYGPSLKMTGNGVGVYFGDPDGNPLALSCSEGYVREDLRRIARVWVPQPYDWPTAEADPR